MAYIIITYAQLLSPTQPYHLVFRHTCGNLTGFSFNVCLLFLFAIVDYITV